MSCSLDDCADVDKLLVLHIIVNRRTACWKSTRIRQHHLFDTNMALSDPPDLNKLAEQLQQAGAHLKSHAEKADFQQDNTFFDSLGHMKTQLENIETALNVIKPESPTLTVKLRYGTGRTYMKQRESSRTVSSVVSELTGTACTMLKLETITSFYTPRAVISSITSGTST
jgi:hypothetical protein